MTTTPDVDDPFLLDLKGQREYDLKKADINAKKEIDLARIAAANADERRIFFGWCLAGLAVIAVIAGIIVAISWNVTRSHQQEDRNKAREAQIAQACIRDGNVWLHGDCIPAKKS